MWKFVFMVRRSQFGQLKGEGMLVRGLSLIRRLSKEKDENIRVWQD